MLKRLVRLSAMLLLLWLPGAPQSGLRDVTGVVSDKRGNPLPGTSVQLEDTVTLWIISRITGKDGRFHFNRLSGNIDYTLKATYRSYWSKPKTLSKFSSAKELKVDLVIPIE